MYIESQSVWSVVDWLLSRGITVFGVHPWCSVCEYVILFTESSYCIIWIDNALHFASPLTHSWASGSSFFGFYGKFCCTFVCKSLCGRKFSLGTDLGVALLGHAVTLCWPFEELPDGFSECCTMSHSHQRQSRFHSLHVLTHTVCCWVFFFSIFQV